MLSVTSGLLQAQNNTRIWGTVEDSETGEPLPFVNISFDGTTLGTVSSSEGKFYLDMEGATPNLKASFIGYETQIITIKVGQSQKVAFKLKEASVQLENVTVKGKKLKYRNKGNPAVALMKKVIEHRDENRTENLDFVEYDKYEKVEFDFNNITEKFKNKRIMKPFQMVFDYVDTSEVNGKTYLPIFIRETSSKVYYRKDPRKEIEYRKGQKMTGFHDYLNNQGISMLIDKMYQEVDIYDNNINVLTQKFVSPISGLAPVTYKYYIADTLFIEGEKLYKLAFQPRNENNLAFVGNLFITTDSAYAVKKVSMRISKKINLNYVNDLFIDQEFEKTEYGSYIIKVDKISIDFDIPGKMDMYGKRTVSFKDRIFNTPQPDEIYADLQNVIEEPDLDKKTDEFWKDARHMELSKSEKGVYKMVEEVKELPAFKRMMDILFLVAVGYKDFGPFSVGPVNTFYSWNDVEGFRVRLGGQTNNKFSEKFQVKAYGAYAWRDKEWKYSTEFFYYRNKNPLDAFKFTYQNEIRNPGEELMFVQEDNFLLSFKRGVNNKQIYNKNYQFEYMKQLKHGISYTVGVKKLDMTPGGILSFAPGTRPIQHELDFTPKAQREAEVLKTAEVNLSLRIAPNEQYYEGIQFRVPIYNKHPIFTMRYDKGFKGVFDSPYSYDKVSLGIFKRTYVPPFGYFDTELEGNKIWGQVPYALLNVPRANQTYSYQIRSYNLMNFLEFVSDRFVSLQYAHYFNGYFLNKVPLLKKLKWRSVVTFKGLMGSVSDLNNPSLHPELPGYPIDENGNPVTSALDHYLETSIGIGNIFKIFRVDLVKRWTQLDQEGIASGYNIRGRFKIEF
ncbi:MAG: carboxypeptidase-like regulatory domain-containing protein [Cyclobacteriaceae bacterium]